MKDLIATIARMADEARSAFASTKEWTVADSEFAAVSCQTIRVPVAMLNRVDELAAAAFIQPHDLDVIDWKARFDDLHTAAKALTDCLPINARNLDQYHARDELIELRELLRTDPATAARAADAEFIKRVTSNLPHPPDDAVTALMDANWKLPEATRGTEE